MKKYALLPLFFLLIFSFQACDDGGEETDTDVEGDVAADDEGQDMPTDGEDDVQEDEIESDGQDADVLEDVVGDAEDGTDVEVETECTIDDDCDDLEPCNGDETCAEGTCLDGTPLDDGEPCETADEEAGTCSEGVCVPAECGNGIVDEGEECDDGNEDNTDDCLNRCRDASCGDGYVWADHEECDDGNDIDTDACPTTCVPAECGDGFVWTGEEECDDGNDVNTDACLDTCENAECGDGFVWTDMEECDDGNDVPDDECTNDCTLAGCGDGIVQEGEECDDGNDLNTDSCLNECLDATCGDGFVWEGREACDDGNDIPDDECTNECTSADCGDCILQDPPEECDDCDDDNTDDCLDTCLEANCGDGYIHEGFEECDDGNGSDSDGCVDECVLAECGDWHLWVGVEDCDDGNDINTDDCVEGCVDAECGDTYVWADHEECDDGNDLNTDACLNTCIAAECGDGFLWDGTEACDDGNLIDTDACLTTCVEASCHDGFVWEGVELCDDGNLSDTDSCVDECVPAECGDGHVWDGVEQCDDGNDINDDGCTNDCTLPECGDGIEQEGEECDDGNSINTDACLNTCFDAECGDGVVWDGVEECDDANLSNSDACVEGCLEAECGDGFRWLGMEECDDGNDINTDACLDTCDNAECGDGFIWADNEECDDGNPDNTDECTTECLSAECGDGYIWLDVEECDDGNDIDTDACPTSCQDAECGDGFVWADNEECDDGNAINTDACVEGCLDAVCGDGFLWEGVETCDDGNTEDGDGCNSTCSSVLQCEEFMPRSLSNLSDSLLTVTGELFATGMHVHLVDVETATDYDVGVATVNGTGTVATITVTAGTVPVGRYALRLVNPDTGESTCQETITVKGLAPPTVISVIPAVAWRGDSGDGILSDQPVTVIGTNFRITPTVRWVLSTDPRVHYDATEVNWISDTELTAICPSESLAMPLGFYHVDVINPDGLSGRWSELFEVTDVPPPKIVNINPSRGPRASDVPMTITGQYFQDGAGVSFELADGTRLVLDSMYITVISSTEIQIVIPGGFLPAQGLYPVWVTNPDGREDVYNAYNATSSAAGHWNDPFLIIEGADMLTGRERHDMVYGCDVYGNTYMYLVGGITGGNTVLDDVEISEVSMLGDPAPWQQSYQYQDAANPRIVNRLTTARHGLAVVVGHHKWLYAMGGASQDTNVITPPVVDAESSIERAFVLAYDTMPGPRMPILHGGGGLPFGTWYYRVSAIGSWGESLANREMQARNTSGIVDVCWHPVPGAASYNIYRSPAADGRSQSTRLLVTEVAGPCYTDNGRGVNQVAPGRLTGTTQSGAGLGLGTWTYRVTAVVGGTETIAGYREYVSVTDLGTAIISLRWDPVPGAVFNLYRSDAAVVTPTGDEETYLLVSDLGTNSFVDDNTESLTMGTTAPDGIPPLPPGSLSKWETLTVELGSAREGADAIAITVPSGTEMDPDKSFVYVAGGRPDNSRTGYHQSVEKAEIGSDGSLGNFSAETSMNIARAFLSLQTSWLRDDTPACPPPPEPPCEDKDGDGHYAMWCGGDDCNDNDPTIYPGAPEICGDGIDQDCDGIDPPCDCEFPDIDGDGHDRPECGGDDCCDWGTEDVMGCTPETADQIYPGAEEICEDGIDQDCDGCDPLCSCVDMENADQDGDGYISDACCGDDCCDSGTEDIFGCTPETAPDIHPGAEDIPCDGIDQDCDGIDFCEPDSLMGPRTPWLEREIDFSWWDEGLQAAINPQAQGLMSMFAFDEPVDTGFKIPGPEPSYSLATETIYLVAANGDEEQDINNNEGLPTFEVSVLAPGEGVLGAWTTQHYEANKQHMGHGTYLYAGYLFLTLGVWREDLGDEPGPLGSSFTRFPFEMTPDTPDLFLGSQTSTASGFDTDRCYYGYQRLNSYIFVSGGNAGGATGPIGTMERLPE